MENINLKGDNMKKINKKENDKKDEKALVPAGHTEPEVPKITSTKEVKHAWSELNKPSIIPQGLLNQLSEICPGFILISANEDGSILINQKMDNDIMAVA